MKSSAGKFDPSVRLEDMCVLAEKRGRPVYSSFLNEREQYEAEKLLGSRRGISIELWGGDSACVRRMLCVALDFAGIAREDFPIYPLTLSFRRADKPGHRDFLGAFMGLGIERETVGDIFIGEGTAAVFCTKTARDMITDCVTAVGRIGVSVSDGLTADAKEMIRPAEMKDKIINAASLRADCIVGGITGLSREKSAELIRSGNFTLNYAECLDISGKIETGSILTIRGYGKFLVTDDISETKKGRIRITIKQYI
ncbi:MAG: RNA-binding protein [Ruminiclostridium sp.]|nr:RNA-binding protein [Ruminiclostridium sp.]